MAVKSVKSEYLLMHTKLFGLANILADSFNRLNRCVSA